MVYHVHAEIDTLLKMSNKQLKKMFFADPEKVRAQLRYKLQNGDKLIRADGCNNFDPQKGCMGCRK